MVRLRTHAFIQFSSVQSLSRVRFFVTPWIAARQASLSITISRSSLRLMSIESVMPSSHLILKVKVKVKVKVKSCPTLCDPMECNLQGSSFHGILQATVLEWVAISFSRESSRARDRTLVSCIPGRHFNLWATREAPRGRQIMLKWR